VVGAADGELTVDQAKALRTRHRIAEVALTCRRARGAGSGRRSRRCRRARSGCCW
jgi:hypothetical protein